MGYAVHRRPSSTAKAMGHPLLGQLDGFCDNAIIYECLWGRDMAGYSRAAGFSPRTVSAGKDDLGVWRAHAQGGHGIRRL